MMEPFDIILFIMLVCVLILALRTCNFISDDVRKLEKRVKELEDGKV